LPIISYSDDRIDLLKDSIKIYEYDNNKNKFKTITNFLMLSGLKIEELSGKKGSDRRRYTEDASSKITNMFKGSWNQAKIRVDVWIDGDEIHFGIEDESGIKEVPPTKRSDGFQWYLAFYINFMAGAKGDLRNSILLLDNPGLQLHPSGQKDLLSVLEELSKENQIIYTTHSPYLIDIEHLDKVRIIEKHNDNGTIINEKYYCSDLDSLKPIRDSLGFTLKDSLFISDENIIVEGPSDKYIIEGMLSYLRDSFDWDPSKLAINSPGGANKIPYYAFFMASEGLKFVAILDNDNAGDLAAKELKKNPNLSETQIIKIDQIVNIKDITIEDISLQLNRRRLAGRGLERRPRHIAREASRADSRHPGRRTMKVEIKDNKLFIEIDLEEPTPSSSGKTLVVASTHGNIVTTAKVNDKPITIGLNAYIKP
jgi:hypothetical protein